MKAMRRWSGGWEKEGRGESKSEQKFPTKRSKQPLG